MSASIYLPEHWINHGDIFIVILSFVFFLFAYFIILFLISFWFPIFDFEEIIRIFILTCSSLIMIFIVVPRGKPVSTFSRYSRDITKIIETGISSFHTDLRLKLIWKSSRQKMLLVYQYGSLFMKKATKESIRRTNEWPKRYKILQYWWYVIDLDYHRNESYQPLHGCEISTLCK